MLSEDRIHHLAGALDDWQVAAIIKTRATEKDLRAALVWLAAQGDLTAERAEGLPLPTRQVIDILTADAPPAPDED